MRQIMHCNQDKPILDKPISMCTYKHIPASMPYMIKGLESSAAVYLENT